ncbi:MULTISPECIES: hypothetical protein [Pseudomonas]|uniref:hypothetical protein n=1 Tax=Pseudomonas TaxID=286 RepID=UPI0011A993F8|nr:MULTISPECIES: hypothetical protein [Pseudomonas]MBI6923721.1 hypothetical protein [Pseudomonas putida]
MTHDGMTSKEKDVYERYVIKCLQEAGIEDTSSATVLQTLDKDAFDRAIDQMKEDTDFRFKPESTTTVAQLAEVIWRASQSM